MKTIYDNMTREQMISLLTQRNDLLKEQHQIIIDLKQRNNFLCLIEEVNKATIKRGFETINIYKGIVESKYNLNKRGSTIFYDVV